jgi:hypothetical protein
VTEQAPPEVRATERWFIRQGLPMLVEEYSAGRDVWTRALPVLAFLFVLSVITSVTLARSWIGVTAILGGCALALAAYAWVNVRRGRGPFELPRRVGAAWLVAFVVVPALVGLAVSRDVEGAVDDLLLGTLTLAVVYLVSRYALVALLSWAVRWTFRQLGNVTRLVTRVLPLLLLFITFLFINTEVWQVAGTMQAPVLWGSLAVFGAIGLAFIVGRSREEFGGIEITTDAAEVVALTRGTPMADAAPGLDGLDEPVPMHGRQRANLVAVLVTAQAVQVALVGAVVWAFFVVFGSLAISIPVQENWLGSLAPVEVLWPLGESHGVTRSLVRVATFLGGFAGFYATVYAANDSVYREQFVSRISATVERAVAVRRAYVVLRRESGLPVSVPAAPVRAGDELDS